MRRLTSTHWFRVGLASVSAAGILTALFALAGHSEISVTLQSALVHAAGMTVLVSLTMPWLRRCVEGQPAPLGWGLKIAALLPLAALEARLQPHFMFNTLNAISALIQDNPEEAERTIERLAALLRFALDATERGLVPLDHELKIVTDYVEIERTRFGERLTYAI